MKNLADFLKVPESLDKFDHDNYILGLIFANRSFFKFEVIDDDLKVCEKDSGKEVFYKKNYFMFNEVDEYQKKSLGCNDEFELDLPLKANISDMMYIVDIDWEYSNDNRIIGVSDTQVHKVKVTEISGSSDTNILLTLSQYKSLYPKIKRDALIILCINKQYSVMKTNELLDEYGFEILR